MRRRGGREAPLGRARGRRVIRVARDLRLIDHATGHGEGPGRIRNRRLPDLGLARGDLDPLRGARGRRVVRTPGHRDESPIEVPVGRIRRKRRLRRGREVRQVDVDIRAGGIRGHVGVCRNEHRRLRQRRYARVDGGTGDEVGSVQLQRLEEIRVRADGEPIRTRGQTGTPSGDRYREGLTGRHTVGRDDTNGDVLRLNEVLTGDDGGAVHGPIVVDHGLRARGRRSGDAQRGNAEGSQTSVDADPPLPAQLHSVPPKNSPVPRQTFTRPSGGHSYQRDQIGPT